MKSAVLFFLSLCFLVLGRYEHAHSKTSSHPVSTSVQKTSHLNEKKADLISVEDEDEDLSFNKKNLQPVKPLILCGYQTSLPNCDSYLAKRLPFCRHVSYTSSHKYILQRVLRI